RLADLAVSLQDDFLVDFAALDPGLDLTRISHTRVGGLGLRVALVGNLPLFPAGFSQKDPVC
ncbi:MAG: hypothetical protein ACO3JG_14640, partial [Luteolibacter sp.]